MESSNQNNSVDLIDLTTLTLRQLQQETARALTVMGGSNHDLARFNKQANHDSQNWYRVIIQEYINQYGQLPSVTGPGTTVRMISDV